jgi:hypothetical protein
MRRSRRGASLSGMTHDDSSLTRRQVLAGAGGTGLLAAAGPLSVLGSARPASRTASAGDSADGTPEQIHLTWGADPTSSVTVSWASSGPAAAPRVLLDPDRIVPAVQRTYTDGLNGDLCYADPPIEPGTSFYIRGYSGGAQTTWLARTLAAARRDPSIDWIIAQMHQIACSSSATGNGSDLGIRQAWLPLFDRYQVDLVLNGHDHDYERSFPCRGFDSMVGTEVATGAPVQTLRPHPVTTDDTGVFDTTRGTVHLVLGCGGTDANLDDYGLDAADGMRQAKVFTKPNRPVATSTAGVFARAAADAVEDAPWSARRDTATGYGIAVFDVDPGAPGGMTSINVTHYHALGADPVNPATGEAGAPTPDYTEFETFTLVRPRSDHPGRGAGAPERVGAPGSG